MPSMRVSTGCRHGPACVVGFELDPPESWRRVELTERRPAADGAALGRDRAVGAAVHRAVSAAARSGATHLFVRPPVVGALIPDIGVRSPDSVVAAADGHGEGRALAQLCGLPLVCTVAREPELIVVRYLLFGPQATAALVFIRPDSSDICEVSTGIRNIAELVSSIRLLRYCAAETGPLSEDTR